MANANGGFGSARSRSTSPTPRPVALGLVRSDFSGSTNTPPISNTMRTRPLNISVGLHCPWMCLSNESLIKRIFATCSRKHRQKSWNLPRAAHFGIPARSQTSSSRRTLSAFTYVAALGIFRWPLTESYKISGPGLPSLSFYDLPGVINQTENVSGSCLARWWATAVTDD